MGVRRSVMAEKNKYEGTVPFVAGVAGPDTPPGVAAEYTDEQLARAEEEGWIESVDDRQSRLEQLQSEREKELEDKEKRYNEQREQQRQARVAYAQENR
jgi:hypothetical protein